MTTPAPEGFTWEETTFENLREGDVIPGPQGPVTLRRRYDTHVPERMFRLELEDGRVIDASGNHLWYIETRHHYSMARERLRMAKRVFRGITPSMAADLLELAEHPQEVETSLRDLVSLLELEDSREGLETIYRVASSLGHVAEEGGVVEDLYTGEHLEVPGSLRTYDARRFAQQLLALSSRRYRRRWPLVVGEVVTTEDLISMDLSTVTIPALDDARDEEP